MASRVEEALVRALSSDELREALEAIVRREEELRREWPGRESWWSWRLGEVGLSYHTVAKLVRLGLVRVTYSSGRQTYYRLVDYEATRRALEEWERGLRRRASELLPGQAKGVPRDLFETIEGHDELKWVFAKSLRTTGYHILLVGPPASGKTLFMLEIARLPGAVFVDVPHATRVGIRELILEYRPRYLLLDELDKATSKDFLNGLGNIMETGMLVVAKHGKYERIKVDLNIYATANSLRRIPEHIRSRFDIYVMPPYSDEELIRVITGLLVKRYGKPRRLAEAIAQAVVYDLKTRDPRDAVRIAKIVETVEDLRQYVRVKKKYGGRSRISR